MFLMMKGLIIFVLFITSTVSNISVAASNEVNASTVVYSTGQSKVSSEILNLVELSTINPNKAGVWLKKITVSGQSFNYAEQYLIHLIKANIKQHQQEHEKVVVLIEEAKSLTKYIAEDQLKSPLFANSYLVLANSYEVLKDYSQAYQNKKIYVDYYNDYSNAKREINLTKLTEKYEVAHKIEENKLLDNQNKLEELRIDDVYKQQEDLKRKFILIICTIFLFFLLFLRQLKVRNKLLVLSKTDSLTGLLNRMELFKQGHDLVKTAHEKQLELSVLLFDIDHFKLINNQFGHAVGDLVLKKIAALVNETMRARDIFAHLGGEEFVAILPCTNIDQAKAIAVRVIEKIEQSNFTTLGVNINITLSIGVTSLKDNNATFDNILHTADLAMCQAKAEGRNQMVSYIN
jgi:diguanylate cyclase (GGDEF)-like protein